MISVAHREIIGAVDRATNAQEHNVTKALAGRIVRAAKKNRSYLQERQEKELTRQTLVDAVRALHDNWDE